MKLFVKKKVCTCDVSTSRFLRLEELESRHMLSCAPLSSLEVGASVEESSGTYGPQRPPEDVPIRLSEILDAHVEAFGPQKVRDDLLVLLQSKRSVSDFEVLKECELRNVFSVVSNKDKMGNLPVSVSVDAEASSSTVIVGPQFRADLSSKSLFKDWRELQRKNTYQLWEEPRVSYENAYFPDEADETDCPLPIQDTFGDQRLENDNIGNEADLEARIITRSGGSGSSGGSSGGGSTGIYTVNAYLSGSTSYFLEGDTVYISYSWLPTGCVVSATCSGSVAIDSDRSVLSSSSSSGLLSIKTIDDLLPGTDKELTISLSISGDVQTTLTQSSFSVTVLERPEFISFEDRSSQTIAYNDDSYRTYVDYEASAGATVHVRGNSIAAKGGSGLRYCLANPSPFFEINPETGAVSLKLSAKRISELGFRYLFSISIRAYESRMTDGLSSGSGWSDDATVTISIAHWNINRNGGNKALVSANDGCTISMLANEIGLTVSEFNDWLTITGDNTIPIELFDGSSIAVNELTANSVLATTSRFRIPNTVCRAWFGEIGGVGQVFMGWNTNESQLRSLGFNVITFDNDSYRNVTADEAKNCFWNQLKDATTEKELQGLYMVGHGTLETIGSSGTNIYTVGPRWNISYGLSIGEEQDSIASALKYRLGALLIFACSGDKEVVGDDETPSDSHNLVSVGEKSVFRGFTNAYNPFLQDHDPIGKYWNVTLKEVRTYATGAGVGYMYIYQIGGKQGTKTDEITCYYQLHQD